MWTTTEELNTPLERWKRKMCDKVEMVNGDCILNGQIIQSIHSNGCLGCPYH